MNTDDFWNESSARCSNFFDEDDNESIETEEVGLHLSPNENSTLPIHSIISKKSLNMLLDEIHSNLTISLLPPKETIKRMFYDEFVVLNYKTLEDKLQLLDAAIELGDGNVIMRIILFLKKSLNGSLFLHHIAKRKVAVKHYVNYTIEAHELKELADLYQIIGNVSNMKDIFYLIIRDTSGMRTLHSNLKQFVTDHGNLFSSEERTEMEEVLQFYDWQVKNQSNFHAPVKQLYSLCKNKKNLGRKIDDPISSYQIMFQLEGCLNDWAVMNAFCQLELWDKLKDQFITTVWLSKKRSLKTQVQNEFFVNGIGSYKPPEEVMHEFFACMDASTALRLAEKLGYSSFVINHYLEQKDRIALLKFQDVCDVEGRQRIQDALKDKSFKWKN